MNRNSSNNNNNVLRTQFPYQPGDGLGLSPRPLYDFPSPTSNYPSGVGPVSPGFFPMAAQISPRFGGSAFIPPPDIFVEQRKDFGMTDATYPLQEFRRRMSEVNRDPVAMHLLVETAMIDSQKFDILTVEEVESLKQEQKGLDTRLLSTRRKLESETKIRDAARSLTRLTSKKDKGRQMSLSRRGSNSAQDTSSKSEEELQASNRKVDDLTRELLEIESRMRLIDMQLLMHTAAVLQMTHNGPRKRKQNTQMVNGDDRRPDSPASIYTYENDQAGRSADDGFDERSFYRSPENLDSLMNALQNGTHQRTESIDRQNQALTSMSKRLEDLNERIRELIVQANPERSQQYSLPPKAPAGTVDASSVDRQLDFLDQGLQIISSEQSQKGAQGSMNAVEERLEGINNQLYAMLSKNDDRVSPPPAGNNGALENQLSYMEDSLYNLGQLQYSLYEQIDNLRSQPSGGGNEEVEKYETTIMGLWQLIQTGEEEARERKRQRRCLLAEDPDNEEELSPDEDYINEQYSLLAFSAKVQSLFRKAASLKDKQAILMRQIKQQRELNSKSDAQKEEQFSRLNEQILSARSEKKTMEGELDRAISQLREFEGQKVQVEEQALRNIESRNTALEQEAREAKDRAAALESQLSTSRDEAQARVTALETQLQQAQAAAATEAAAIQTQLAQSSSKIEETTTALQNATLAKEEAEQRSSEAQKALEEKEKELLNLESEVVRLTTELTFAKAELDGAYGTRAQRAAESGASTKKELDDLLAKNSDYAAEIEALQKISEAASQSEQQARESERNLKAELAGMAADYEALTRDAIQNEKDRDALEAAIDKLRNEKEALEMELSDERVKWLGIRSPIPNAGGAVGMAPEASAGATSIRMLREDFRKMMRERTAEGLRALRNEQEERRKLEAIVRQMRKDATPPKSNLSAVRTAGT